MDITQNNQQELRPLEAVCSVLLFLSLVLNDSLGDVGNLKFLSKGAILLFMVCAAALLLVRNIRLPLVFPILLVLNLLWWVLSCFWAPGDVSFVSTLAQNVLFCFFAFCFFVQSKNYDLIFWAMFASGFLLILYSVGVYGVSGFLEALQEEERIGTEFTNANTYGKAFSYAVVAGLYLALYKKKWLCLAGSLLFLFFALSSGSKKAILIILIGSALLFFFRFGLKKPVQLILWSAIILLTLYFVIRLPIFSVAYERFTVFLSGEKNVTDRLRADMIAKGLAMFREKPVVGWGMTAFAEVSGFASYAHNNFVELLANYGVVGFGLFYSLYLYILAKFRLIFKTATPAHLMMLTVLLAVLITDYGIVSYGIKWNWIVIGTAGAMAVNLFRESKCDHNREENTNAESVT